MMQMVRDLFWGEQPLGDLVGKNDAEYKKARELFHKKADAFEKQLSGDMAEAFGELLDLRSECSAAEQESAFALGCGFAFALLLDTLPRIQTNS